VVSFEGSDNDDGVSECDIKREDERQYWVRPTATRQRGWQVVGVESVWERHR
jgi:hypothetical protein